MGWRWGRRWKWGWGWVGVVAVVAFVDVDVYAVVAVTLFPLFLLLVLLRLGNNLALHRLKPLAVDAVQPLLEEGALHCLLHMAEHVLPLTLGQVVDGLHRAKRGAFLMDRGGGEV